jgi:phage terminase large subunit GpA-like protein
MTPEPSWRVAGVRAVFASALAELVPPPKLDPVAWGRRYRKISAREASRPGSWDPDRTPWVHEILWELSDESPAKIVVFPKGAQIGATELGLVWSGWSFDQDPGTMITLWPTDAVIKRNVKQRIDPFLASAEPMQRLFGQQKSRSAENTLFQKSSPAGEWIFASAKSAPGLRSTPAVRAMADEIDEAADDLAGQGDVVELLKGRLSDAGPRMKLFVPCTPTVEGKSIVWRWYQMTDQRQFEVPCPNCGAMQALAWERFRWPEGRPQLVEYLCTSCEGAVREAAKAVMLPEGRFRATQETRYHGAVGFHVSGLYAPLGSYSWAQIATDFEAAGARDELLKTIYNLRLGLPWRQTTEAPAVSALRQHEEPYVLGDLPARCGAVTIGGDVQKDRIELRAWGWGEGLESWLVGAWTVERFDRRIEAGAVTRDRRKPEAIAADILALTEAGWRRQDGAVLHHAGGAIDVNFDSDFSWRLVIALGSRWHAIRGEARGRPGRLHWTSRVAREGVGSELLLHHVASPSAISEFYRHLSVERPADPEGSWAGYVHLSTGLSDAELEELTAEREVFDPRKRKRVWVRAAANHAGDCRKYARAMVEAAGLDLWTADHWAQRAEALRADALRRRTGSQSTTGQATTSFLPRFS